MRAKRRRAKSPKFRGDGGEIPRELAPARAKSQGISPRGQIPGGGGCEIPATPAFRGFGRMHPGKNEICGPPTAGNSLKLSIIPSLRYFVSF